MNSTRGFAVCKSPLDPPFCKGGKRRARGDFRELAVSFVLYLQALKPLLGQGRKIASLPFLLLFLSLFACSSQPEKSKALVKISNVKVWRTDEQTLKVSLDYDLEVGVRLPLPYKEILVFPLEPQVKLAGTLAPFELHVGTVGVTLPVPKDAIDWEDLNDQDTCCIVSLKGMKEGAGTKTSSYERISNEVRVLPPQISG
jgi:hypothetical protein